MEDSAELRRLRREVARVSRRLHGSGLVAAQDGNVSVRLPPSDGGEPRMLVTPSGFPLGAVRPRDLVVVDGEGRVLAGARPPSSEWRMHRALYDADPGFEAVVHAHPPHATAFAVSGRGLERAVLPEVVVKLGRIPLAPYATPATPAVGEGLSALAREGCSAFLLENHGATTAGADVWDAYYRMEKLEHAARILWLATLLGGPNELPPGEAERLRQLYR